MEGWVDLGVGYILRWFTCPQTVTTHPGANHLIATRPGVQPMTSLSQVQCPNCYTTKPPSVSMMIRPVWNVRWRHIFHMYNGANYYWRVMSAVDCMLIFLCINISVYVLLIVVHAYQRTRFIGFISLLSCSCWMWLVASCFVIALYYLFAALFLPPWVLRCSSWWGNIREILLSIFRASNLHVGYEKWWRIGWKTENMLVWDGC